MAFSFSVLKWITPCAKKKLTFMYRICVGAQVSYETKGFATNATWIRFLTLKNDNKSRVGNKTRATLIFGKSWKFSVIREMKSGLPFRLHLRTMLHSRLRKLYSVSCWLRLAYLSTFFWSLLTMCHTAQYWSNARQFTIGRPYAEDQAFKCIKLY